jgi:hypothetical protein
MRRILVLYAYPPGKGEMRLAVAQHLHALDGLGDDVVYVNAHDGSPSWLRHQVFDAVVLHTTFLWYRTRKKHRRAWTWLRELDCRKVALPQDEYYLAHVLDDWLLELGVDHVFSVFEEPLRSMIYPRLSGRATFSTALTGYIDEETAAYCRHRHRPLAERPLDIGYRTRPPRFWLGRHGLLKPGIGAAVLERAGTHALKAEPAAARLPEGVRDGWALAEVTGEDAVRLILRPRPRPHEPLAPVGQPPQRPRPLVRRPHLLQQPGGEQPRERAGIEAVRLCLRLGDRAQLARVGDHHPDPVAFEHRDDPVGASRRLERHDVARKQAPREQL